MCQKVTWTLSDTSRSCDAVHPSSKLGKYSVLEEGLEALERVLRVAVGVSEARDGVEAVRDHPGGCDAEERIVGQGDARAPRAEGQIGEARPRAREGVDVHVVRRVQESADHREAPLGEALPPVEVRRPPALVAERRPDEADVARLEAEGARRNVRVAVAVLDLPDESAPVVPVAVDQIPGTEEAVHAGAREVIACALVREEGLGAVVATEVDSRLLLDPGLPVAVRLQDVQIDEGPLLLLVLLELVLHGVRAAEARGRPGTTRDAQGNPRCRRDPPGAIRPHHWNSFESGFSITGATLKPKNQRGPNASDCSTK
jgi:hypothetical protein